jgi:NAD(P)H-dependent flavin oxidoreductase YrpB (nitropropane dioxygenase family)
MAGAMDADLVIAAAPLKVAAEKLGRVDFTNLWAGQAIRLSREMPAAELTRRWRARRWRG